MKRGGLDDPEKDPSLFPESRVRPWVVDEEAERKVRDDRDDLERTLTFVSPVKEGQGVSTLDRILADDQRGRMFFKELERLQLEKKASDERQASGVFALRPISEVFEDLYRERHGLPPRREHSPDVLCTKEAGGIEDEDPLEAARTAEETSEPKCSESEGVEMGLEVEKMTAAAPGVDELAEDPEIKRLMEILRMEDVDVDSCAGSDSETSVISSQEGEDSRDNSGADDEIDNCGEGKDGGRCGGDEGDMVKRSVTLGEQGNDAPTESPAEGDDEKRGNGGAVRQRTKKGRRRGNKNRERGNKAAPCAQRDEVAPVPLTQPRPQQQSQERIDISRIKIDGTERGAFAGPRPHSAPSACLSSGGFSRLSRTSSSHLARTVSQRLLQAERELAERRGLEERESTAVPPFLADPGVGIDAVRQNADALQASRAVKRRSYLKGCRPRTVRWVARGTAGRYPESREITEGYDSDEGVHRGGNHSKLYSRSTGNLNHTVARNQRLPMGDNRTGRCRLVINGGGSRSTPLFTRAERNFVFGKHIKVGAPAATAATAPVATPAPAATQVPAATQAPAAASAPETTTASTVEATETAQMAPSAALMAVAADETDSVSLRPPSARQTTPGKLLQRAATASRQRQPRSRRPYTHCEVNHQADRGVRTGRDSLGDSSVPKIGVDTARNGRVGTKKRPASATPGTRGKCRSTSASTASDTTSRGPGWVETMTGRRSRRLSDRRKERFESSGVYRGNVMGTSPSPAVCGAVTSGKISRDDRTKDSQFMSTMGTGDSDRSSRCEMNVHQALKATLQATACSVSPRTQFASTRELIAVMKKVNTKDSTGDLLSTTQGISKKRIDEDCWTSESSRQYVTHPLGQQGVARNRASAWSVV